MYTTGLLVSRAPLNTACRVAFRFTMVTFSTVEEKEEEKGHSESCHCKAAAVRRCYVEKESKGML